MAPISVHPRRRQSLCSFTSQKVQIDELATAFLYVNSLGYRLEYMSMERKLRRMFLPLLFRS